MKTCIVSPPGAGQLQLPRGRQAAPESHRWSASAFGDGDGRGGDGGSGGDGGGSGGGGDCSSNVGSGSAGTATATAAAAATVVSVVAAPPAVAWVRRASHRAPGFAPRHAASCCPSSSHSEGGARVRRPCGRLLPGRHHGRACWVLAGYRRSLGRASAIAAGWRGQPARDKVHVRCAHVVHARGVQLAHNSAHSMHMHGSVCMRDAYTHIYMRAIHTHVHLTTCEGANTGASTGRRSGRRAGRTRGRWWWWRPTRTPTM